MLSLARFLLTCCCCYCENSCGQAKKNELFFCLRKKCSPQNEAPNSARNSLEWLSTKSLQYILQMAVAFCQIFGKSHTTQFYEIQHLFSCSLVTSDLLSIDGFGPMVLRKLFYVCQLLMAFYSRKMCIFTISTLR